jgi:hypothetical protein
MKLESHDTPLGRFIVASGPELDAPAGRSLIPLPGGPTPVDAGADPLDRFPETLRAQFGRLVDRFRSEPDPAIVAIRQEAEAAIEELDATFTRLLEGHITALRHAPRRAAPAKTDPDPTIVDADLRVVEASDKETPRD